jgi:hypothetical protein
MCGSGVERGKFVCEESKAKFKFWVGSKCAVPFVTDVLTGRHRAELDSESIRCGSVRV